MSHNYQDLIHLFNSLFEVSEQTILVGGSDEPIYLPKDENNNLNRIIFRHDYYASALHEIAHWCIAGEERRNLVDFGYWYAPDGRSAEEQVKFEQVEIKPQALECIFAQAAGWQFRVSFDNLSLPTSNEEKFKHKVHDQVLYYLAHGLPMRAELFRQSLAKEYGTYTVSTTSKKRLKDLESNDG